MINPWGILGVHRQATKEEVKAAYRNVMRTAHPDVGGTTEQAAKAAEAYALLTDQPALQKYLGMAALVLPACPACKGKGCRYKQKSLTERSATACTVCKGSGFVGTEVV